MYPRVTCTARFVFGERDQRDTMPGYTGGTFTLKYRILVQFTSVFSIGHLVILRCYYNLNTNLAVRSHRRKSGRCILLYAAHSTD